MTKIFKVGLDNYQDLNVRVSILGVRRDGLGCDVEELRVCLLTHYISSRVSISCEPRVLSLIDPEQQSQMSSHKSTYDKKVR